MGVGWVERTTPLTYPPTSEQRRAGGRDLRGATSDPDKFEFHGWPSGPSRPGTGPGAVPNDARRAIQGGRALGAGLAGLTGL